MSSEEKQKTGEINKESVEFMSPTSKVDAVEHSEAEAENLKLKIAKSNSFPLAGKIGVILITPGVLALVDSIVSNSQVLAFVGLGLTFWGATFFLVQPTRHVQWSLLNSTVITSYVTIDRITRDLKCRGRGLYIPPYPKQAYLPEHLKGLKEMIVYISADESTGFPSIDEIARSKFLFQHPRGVSITPPGLGLLEQFENDLKISPTQVNLQTLCETLPSLVLENFHLAKEMEMKPENDRVSLRIVGSIFGSLYLEEGLRSVHTLGCPLVSAFACAMAKTTGKTVIINTLTFDPKSDTTEVSYRIMKD